MHHTALVYDRSGFVVLAEHKQIKKVETCFTRALVLYEDKWGYEWLSQEKQLVLRRSQPPARMWGLNIEVPIPSKCDSAP
jgi:hypothetical protein